MNLKQASVSIVAILAGAGVALAGQCEPGACTKERAGQRATGAPGRLALEHPRIIGASWQADDARAEALREGRPYVEINESMAFVQKSPDSTIEVRVRNGRVEATVDGKPVPESQIERRDGVVIISPPGREPIRINTGEHAAHPLTLHGGMKPRLAPPHAADEAIQAYLTAAQEGQPKVYLGIAMSEAEPVVLEHLGLGDRKVIKIERVVEGSPAEQAGLEAHDLVIAVADSEEVTPETVRAVLLKKEPGETVSLRIVRKGEQKDLKVKLAPRRAPAADGGFGGSMVLRPRVQGEEFFVVPELNLKPGTFEFDFDNANVRRLLKELEAIELEAEVGAAGKTVRELLKSLQGQARFYGELRGEDGALRRFALPDMQPLDRAPASDLGQRLEELDQRLSDLERKLDRLTSSIDRLAERRQS